MERPELSQPGVVQQLRDLGVTPGAVPVVHTSFRAVRPVQGGPGGLIAASRQAIGPDGTLVMPTMTGSSRDAAYDPATAPTHDGIVADTFWRLAGVLRSDHPTSSFAAAGPLGAAITVPQPLEPVHGLDSPIGRVYQHDGLVLLLGVDHSADTTIHLGEALAYVPYRITKSATVRKGERAVHVTFGETDHCCRNFQRVDGPLRERSLQGEGPVGAAHARLVRSRAVVAVATEHLTVQPTAFLCPRATGCAKCDPLLRPRRAEAQEIVAHSRSTGTGSRLGGTGQRPPPRRRRGPWRPGPGCWRLFSAGGLGTDGAGDQAQEASCCRPGRCPGGRDGRYR